MIVFPVSATVFVILVALGVIGYLLDGVSAFKRRGRRRDKAAALYGRATDDRAGRR